MLIGRTAVAETARGFLAALTITTGCAFFVLGITFLKRTPGVGLGFLVEVFPLFFPLALQFTVPMSVLSACISTFGRMAADRELTALNACGVPTRTVVLPVLAGAALVSLGSLLLIDEVAPYAAARMRQASLDLPRQLQTSFRSGLSDLTFSRGRLSFESFDGQRVRDLCVEYRDPTGAFRILRAREGSFALSGEDDFVIRMHGLRAVVPYSRGNLFVEARDAAAELSLAELTGAALQARKRSDLRAWELAYAGERRLALYGGKERAYKSAVPSAPAMEELARRTAMAAACFFFALIGIPLGILGSRGGRIAGFLTAMAPVLLLFFPLLVGGSNFARQGQAPAYLALWSGNIALGVAGLLLFRKAARR